MIAKECRRSAKTAILASTMSLVLALSLLLVFAPGQAYGATSDTKNTDVSVVLTGGSLTLDKAPQMDFGSHNLSTNTESYAATQSDPIQISDIRGSAAGWKLTVALSNFQIGSTGPQTLNGAYITINSATISAENGTAGTAPALSASTIRLDSDNAAEELLMAESGEGAGVWSANLGTFPTLTVFPGATLGTHVAKLSWVLEDTP